MNRKGIVFTLCLACSLVLCACKASDYSMAKKCIENGEYSEGIEILQSLGEYKDAAELIKSTQYRMARDCILSGNYDDGIAILEALGDYKDAKDIVIDTKQKQAEQYAADGYYAAAIGILERMDPSDYVTEHLLEYKYKQAEDFIEKTEYDKAYHVLTTIPDLDQSNELYLEVRYHQALESIDHSDYEKAVEILNELGGYKDAKEQLKKVNNILNPPVVHLGESIESDHFKITFLDFFEKSNIYYSSYFYYKSDPGFTYGCIAVKLENTTNERVSLFSDAFTYYADNEKCEYAALGYESPAANGYQYLDTINLEAGRAISGYVACNLPVDAKALEIEFDGVILSCAAK